MADSEGSSTRRPWLPALGLCLWFVLVHGRAVDAGLLSDAWSKLAVGSRPWVEALGHPFRYHTSPVTDGLAALEWRLFGHFELGYQVLNLLGLLAVSLLFQRFVSRLTGDLRVATLASGLLVANASFYQNVYWPAVGSFQSLAIALYLLATGAALDDRPWRFATLAGLAFLTYEPMISVVPLALLAPSLRRKERPRQRRLWLAAGAVLLLVAAVKVPVAVAGGQLTTRVVGEASLTTRLGLATRGAVATFAGRGSAPAVEALMGHRPGRDPGLVAGLWLAALATLGAGACFRGGFPVRLAVVWFGGHLAILAWATPIESRHLHLLALPAALLVATAVVNGYAAARRRGVPRTFAVGLAAGFVALLVAGGLGDLARADDVHERATAAVQDLRTRLVMAAAAGRTVHVVNLPARLEDGGLTAFAFLNGTHALFELAVPDVPVRERLRLWRTWPVPRDRKAFANGSRLAYRDELESWAERDLVWVWDDDDGHVVALADAPGSLSRPPMVLGPAAPRLPPGPPSSYEPETAPFLGWFAGGPAAPPEFQIVGRERFALATGGRAGQVRIELLLVPGQEPLAQVAGRRVVVPKVDAEAWRTLEVPIAAGESAAVEIEPRRPLRVRLVSFQPEAP
jgi:hypothetical protein